MNALENYTVAYWKNGARTDLTTPEIDSRGYKIVIQNMDIYVAGSYKSENDNFIACYWKNGIIVDLTTSEISSQAFDIVVVFD